MKKKEQSSDHTAVNTPDNGGVRRPLLGLLGWLAVTFVAAAIGALASIDASQFYAQLQQPDWAPPAGVFGPVWSTLYVLMAVAAWLVWRKGGWPMQRTALMIFVIQLAANALWSCLFFAWHLGGWAFADILLLWLLIIINLLLFWRVHRLAGLLLLPYLVWVSFAVALNYTVWQLNPGLLG